jgi:hypothetical protein
MSDFQSMQPMTGALTKAGATAGTTTTFTTANATLYTLRSKVFSRAAATNLATPTTDITTGAAFNAVSANNGCVFLLCWDSGASALRVAQGPIQALDVSGSFVTAPQWPAFNSDTLCPFAYLVARVASGGSSWTFGTSNLAGPPANTTLTFVDVALGIPDRPQVS